MPADADRFAAIDELALLRALVGGTAASTGDDFFRALVRQLAEVLQVKGAWIAEYLPAEERLRAWALWLDGDWVDGYEYPISGTPCEAVVKDGCVAFYRTDAADLFPQDSDLRAASAVSYFGEPMLAPAGEVIGIVAAMDDQPMEEDPRLRAVFRLFATRAAAEARRLAAEAALRASEERLSRLVGGTMHAIIEVDEDLCLSQLNAPARRLLGGTEEAKLDGRPISDFLDVDGRRRLMEHIASLDDASGARSTRWIGDDLVLRDHAGAELPVESSIARLTAGQRSFYTLVLRDLRERIDAERRIRDLSRREAYLREELAHIHHADTMIGSSPALRALQVDIERIAPTDATVLVNGESGTGKELVARALHARSGRAERPLIKLNCAALPEQLVESELFGHEPGAFTGADRRRDGRFTLADRGTLFLDEVGELPLAVQAKLLRALQEGEFEALGSSHTQRVDVRVIAATNRDLAAMVRRGRFREDLYYRLAVVPLHVPPLRERPEDIDALACAFVARCAQRLGHCFHPLDSDQLARLRGWRWPGNVRELEHVIERAAILSRGPRLDLDRGLHLTGSRADCIETEPERIRTAAEMRALEAANIRAALARCAGQVAGVGGAAELLGIPPSTFSSRMKALGIARERAATVGSLEEPGVR